MILIKETVTSSVEETESLGAELAAMLSAPDSELPSYIAMYGDLGVGKTAFVRGVASVLASGCIVRSPTFAIVNEYRAKGTASSLYHFDMYRITSEDDLYSCGYDDYLDRGVCIVEWCENIPYALPDNYVKVVIEKNSVENENLRKITIFCVDERY
ncbi:MAG: tRNA (adenosine(37)-N6)-threonylcarbamoyltransferase complex ATPase subunit type 1 TsaE [Clostridia bacterium]|nr:tRNA (adenosine(37)-N6)-threonylcarbamoyltransferase complex ATPase subunit type 1 TsaE [Clostridia bacterium]